MCGIAGIIGAKASRETMQKMLERQHHRGPDHTGIFAETGVVLGHNRLSIIDLSEDANQPFYSADGRYVLVFNGEIYNYKELRDEMKHKYSFITESDTEVLLAAFSIWGKECLPRLNGMFAFAIWDTQSHQLFAARDRFGVKPFYYAKEIDTLFFASEIKTLFEAGVDRAPNSKVWASYFAYGSYGMPQESFWEGIYQLPAGHFLLYEKERLSISKWYFFEEEVKKHAQTHSFEAVKSHYKNLLEDSISLRFRADVPVGFNISGGLDSSALLALVNEMKEGKNIHAFTFYTGHSEYDELPWVEQLIGNTQNPLHKVRLDSREVPRLSETLAAQQDEPYGGLPTIAYAKLFFEAREQGIKVLLDGQGMDEQWAGYDYYVKPNSGTIQGVRKSPFKPQVLSKGFLDLAEKPEYPTPFENELLNLQYRDLFYTKIPRALRFNDRVSMAASTELREPFLDYRLVEFAFAQPLEFKIKDGVQKYVLRSLVSEYLPKTIRLAPKRPLQTPQREWLAEDLKDWVQETVLELKENPWFQYDVIEKEMEKYFDGDRDSSFHLWQWLNYSLLMDKNK